MGRDSITDKAREQQQEQKDSADGEDDSQERKVLTQRMSSDLYGRVDEFSDDVGVSVNAAINMLVEDSLRDRNR